MSAVLWQVANKACGAAYVPGAVVFEFGSHFCSLVLHMYLVLHMNCECTFSVAGCPFLCRFFSFLRYQFAGMLIHFCSGEFLALLGIEN